MAAFDCTVHFPWLDRWVESAELGAQELEFLSQPLQLLARRSWISLFLSHDIQRLIQKAVLKTLGTT